MPMILSGEFESKSVLASPEGEPLVETPVTKLDLGAHTRQQIINRMTGFPIWARPFASWPA